MMEVIQDEARKDGGNTSMKQNFKVMSLSKKSKMFCLWYKVNPWLR